MSYVLARLREPGTLRSLAVVLFALRALLPDRWAVQVVDVETAQSFIEVLILALGGASAFMPERKIDPVVVAETVAPVVAAEVRDTLAEVAPVGSALRAGLNRLGAGR